MTQNVNTQAMVLLTVTHVVLEFPAFPSSACCDTTTQENTWEFK